MTDLTALKAGERQAFEAYPTLAGWIEKLALECKHNLRQMLSRIEAGEMLA